MSIPIILGWIVLLTGPVSGFGRLFSGSVINVLLAPLSFIGAFILGMIIFAFGGYHPGPEAIDLYFGYAVVVGVFTLGSKIFS